MSLPKFAWFRRQIVPYGEAKVGVLTHTLNYGTGIFAGLRGYWNGAEKQLFVFRPADHFRRFLQSAKLLSMDFGLSEDDLFHSLLALLRAEDYQQDCYIRPFGYFADETISSSQPGELRAEVSMVAIPFKGLTSRENGLHVTVSSWRRIDDTIIPARGKIAGGYVNTFLARTDALRAGFDDVLLLNNDGHVSEGSLTNFFLIRNGVACTPPITDNILEGITRNSLITLLRQELGIPVEERPIDRSEIYVGDEAFLCGTATQLAPITRIDYRALGTGKVGPITGALS